MATEVSIVRKALPNRSYEKETTQGKIYRRNTRTVHLRPIKETSQNQTPAIPQDLEQKKQQSGRNVR